MNTPEPTKDLAGELAKYENKWVAIAEPEEKIVGSGENALEAKLEAERNGYADAALFKVGPFDRGFIS
jgi:hypothetical protein